jgi:hypothetical protein
MSHLLLFLVRSWHAADLMGTHAAMERVTAFHAQLELTEFVEDFPRMTCRFERRVARSREIERACACKGAESQVVPGIGE